MEKVEELEKKIIEIQKSTQTLMPFMIGPHNFLRSRFRFYYYWHLFPAFPVVHWGTAFVSLLVAVLLVLGTTFPGKRVLASTSTKTWSSQSDFESNAVTDDPPGTIGTPATTRTNVDTAGTPGSVSISSVSQDVTQISAYAGSNVNCGAGMVYTGGYYYAALRFASGNTSRFRRYDPVNNSWADMNVTGIDFGCGNRLATDGTYIFFRYSTDYAAFLRYTISGDSWTDLNNAPTQGFSNAVGATIVGNYYYQGRGTGVSTVDRYNISGNSWGTVNGAPWSFNQNAAFTTDGTYLYATRGRNSASFARYDIAGNSWSDPAVADLPAAIPDANNFGHNLVRIDDYIYAFSGDGTTTFYRYSISGNSWTTLNNLPAAISAGAAMASDGTDLYAVRGNTTLTFWNYNASADSFGTTKPYDGTISGLKINALSSADWSTLSWNTSSLPAGTAVKFRTRGAATEGGLSAASWSDYITSSGSAIATADSIWLEEEMTLVSSGSDGPTLTDFSVDYVQNVNPNDPTSLGGFVDGSWTADSTPDLTFSLSDPDGGDTVQYQIQVDDTAGFPSPVVDYTSALAAQGPRTFTVGQALSGGTYTTGSEGQTLSNNTSYYWQVKAIDNSSASSSYSMANSGEIAFKVDTVGPSLSGSPTFSSIATTGMTVTSPTATDSESGLNSSPYEFDETTSGATFDRTWGTVSYDILGLSPNTQYTFRTRAQDAVSNTSSYSDSASKYTLANTPSALTVAAVSTTSLSADVNPNSNPASTEFAIQETGSSNYVQADGTLGAGVVWQTDAVWGTVTVTGLSTNAQYTFQVKARNGDTTETGFGATDSAYTLANTPDTSTLSAVSSSSLNVVINVNSNPSSTEFAVRVGSNYVQADGTLGASEAWQTYTNWGGASGINVTGLSVNTQYTADVKARNGDSTETGFGSFASKYTLANTPSAPTVSAVSTSSLSVDVNVNSNPASTGFAIQETGSSNYVQADGTLGASSVWQTDGVWGTETITGLSVNTQYTFQVKARNGDNTETAFGSSASATTSSDTTSPEEVSTPTPSENKSPTAKILAQAKVWRDTEISFDGSESEDSDGTISKYTWDFADDTKSTLSKPKHKFGKTGRYGVSLIVEDNGGKQDSTSATVEVIPHPPVIDKVELKSDDTLEISGTSSDLGVAIIYLESQPIQVFTSVKPSGDFSYQYPKASLDFVAGDHSAYARVTDTNNMTSDPSETKNFYITSPSSLVFPEKKASFLEKQLQKILSKEQVEATVKGVVQMNTVLKPTALIVGTMAILFASGFWEIPWLLYYLWTSLMELIGLRKKRLPWGVIYDAVTKVPVPLAVVRIFSSQDRKLLETRVTDRKGRFGFAVEPGEYYITVTKNGYTFVSKLISPQTKQDDVYTNLYLGAVLKIDSKTLGVVNVNIPIDPMSEGAIEEIEKKLSASLRILKKTVEGLRALVRHVTLPILIVSLFFSLFSLFLFFEFYTPIFMILYILILYRELKDRKQRFTWGAVYDFQTKQSLAGASVQIFDVETKRLRETKITSKTGQFGFLVESGKYYLEVKKEDYQFPSKKIQKKNDGGYHGVYTGGEIEKRKGDEFISVNVPLDPA